MTDTIIKLDPSVLVMHDGNRRTDVGDVSGLADSIVELGQIDPISVVQLDDGTYRVVDGKRRVAAIMSLAAALEVEAIVRRNWSDVVARAASLVANLQRKDMTAVEEADAWSQLQLCGWEIDKISTVTGVEHDRIEAGLQVAKSKQATKTAIKHELTLEQAAVLASFDGDKTAVTRLTEAAADGPGNFDHMASRLLRERERETARATQTAALEEAGVKVVLDEAVCYRGLDKPRYLKAGLANDKRKQLTASNHKSCPDHAATVYVDFNGKVEIRYVCMNPRANDHREFSQMSTSRAVSDEAASAERSAVLSGNKDWRRQKS